MGFFYTRLVVNLTIRVSQLMSCFAGSSDSKLAHPSPGRVLTPRYHSELIFISVAIKGSTLPTGCSRLSSPNTLEVRGRGSAVQVHR